MGKLTRKIFFSINFELWWKKIGFKAKQWGMILKTVAYLCRWPVSENFPEAKLFVWKFSVIERKHRISGENVFSGLSKAHFKCPVQHFEKMMIKVNFTFCGWFRTLGVFLLWQESWSGVSNPHTKCTEKKFFEFFSVANVLSKHYQIFSRETWSLTRKYQHRCHNYIHWVRRNTFGVTFWSKVLNISNFLDY